MDPFRRRGDLGGVEELAIGVWTKVASSLIKDCEVLLGSASWAPTRQLSGNVWSWRKTRYGGGGSIHLRDGCQ